MKYLWTGFLVGGVLCGSSLIPFHAKVSYLNFQPLEVVSRYRNPQLQVAENDT